MQTLNFYDIPENSKIKNVAFTDDNEFVALDKNENVLFVIFPYDNGPDYLSDGFIRIVDQDKVGYADLMGEVKITPQYFAAFPFQEGLAAFSNDVEVVIEDGHRIWKNGTWGFISKSGDVVIGPKYDEVIKSFVNGIALVKKDEREFYIDKEGNEAEPIRYAEWTKLLADAFIQKITKDISEEYQCEYGTVENYNGFVAGDLKSAESIIITNNDSKKLASILFIPWQNIIFKTGDEMLFNPLSSQNIVTVSDFSIVYLIQDAINLSDEDREILERLKDDIKLLADHEEEITEDVSLPYEIQVIEEHRYKNYIDLVVAEPGTVLTDISGVFERKMIHLTLTPDVGNVKEQWIKCDQRWKDTYYLSVQDELIEIFSRALKDYNAHPENSEEIYNNSIDQIRMLFNAANSYVNNLYMKFSRLLKVWLQVKDRVIFSNEEMFGDYEPKQTPDVISDFRSELIPALAQLPSPESDNVYQLIELFLHYKKCVEKNAGEWIEGNPILGAKEKEYQPTDDELLLSEIGDRLKAVVESISPDSLKEISAKYDSEEMSYDSFTFIHYDVMGSGRFFYVETINHNIIDLKGKEQ